MKEYVAQMKFYLSKPVEKYIEKGETVLFNGSVVEFRGEEYSMKNLMSAIKDNWLKLPDAPVSTKAKKIKDVGQPRELVDKLDMSTVDRVIPTQAKKEEVTEVKEIDGIKITNNFSKNAVQKRVLPVVRDSEGETYKKISFKHKVEETDEKSFYKAVMEGTDAPKLDVDKDQFDPTPQKTKIIKDEERGPVKKERSAKVVKEKVAKETVKPLLPKNWAKLHYKKKEKMAKETTNIQLLTAMKKDASKRLAKVIADRMKEVRIAQTK